VSPSGATLAASGLLVAAVIAGVALSLTLPALAEGVPAR
jgi:hypothetical protein